MRKNETNNALKANPAEVVSESAVENSQLHVEQPMRQSYSQVTKTHESRRSVCYVGDSVVNSLDVKSVSEVMNAKVTVSRAYTTLNNVHETDAQAQPKLPQRSYRKVTDDALRKDDADILILQAGALDLTTFKTSNNNATRNLEYFKQQTVISAQNLFSVATNSLVSHSKLKKVVILKQVPRYESNTVDSFRIRASMAQLFNDTLIELRACSEHKD